MDENNYFIGKITPFVTKTIAEHTMPTHYQ